LSRRGIKPSSAAERGVGKRRFDKAGHNDLVDEYVCAFCELDQILIPPRIAGERNGPIVRVEAIGECRPNGSVIHQGCRNANPIVLEELERLHRGEGFHWVIEAGNRRDIDVVHLDHRFEVRLPVVAHSVIQIGRESLIEITRHVPGAGRWIIGIDDGHCGGVGEPGSENTGAIGPRRPGPNTLKGWSGGRVP
jgi:hypothetical protein